MKTANSATIRTEPEKENKETKTEHVCVYEQKCFVRSHMRTKCLIDMPT